MRLQRFFDVASHAPVRLYGWGNTGVFFCKTSLLLGLLYLLLQYD